VSQKTSHLTHDRVFVKS